MKPTYKFLRRIRIRLFSDRMPIPIGNFISGHVYNDKLKSVHSITDSLCCRFIDVGNGVEESVGHSWKVVSPSLNSHEHFPTTYNLDRT